MQKLNAAIVGCGAIHGVHADAIVKSSCGKLIAVVDTDENAAKAAALKYKCNYYFNYKDALENDEIDVIHICTPHYLHAPMAVDALRAGKHVLVEKPVALNVNQAFDMIKEAAACDRYLGVAFQNRYNSTSIKMKEILESGILGNIQGVKGIVTWYRSVPYYTESDWRGKYVTEGGGVMINQAIHTLDLMQWFVGEVEVIKGHIDTRVLEGVIEVEDTADATLYFKNGVRGIFYATNSYTTNSPVEIAVHCEKGELIISDGELILKQEGKKERIADDHYEGQYKAYWGDSHSKLISQFYNCITNQLPEGYITAEQGMEALKLIEAIHKSSNKDEKIFL